MFEIKGIITPIITPMYEDESINLDELRNQVNRQIDAGVHGIFPLGTNGEGYILSEREKEQVLSAVIEEAKGRVPIYAGTGCISTKDTIKLSLKAKALGADILSIIVPYFAAASQDELYEHYKSIAKAVAMPIILYNIPARCGNYLSPETVEKLSRIDYIAGIKDSSGNFDNMLQYIERTRYHKDFAVLSGSDSLILWNLTAGGKGAVAGCANVYPKVITAIYDSFIKGNIYEARSKQDSIRSFRNCFKYGNPNTIIKKAVELLGYPVGKCRAPFNVVSEEGLQVLMRVLEENKKKELQ